MAPTAAAQGGGTTSMFQEWLQHLSSNGKLNANENITEQLKENLMTTWADLQSRLKATEPQEVKELCAKVGKLVNHGGNEKDHYLKNICKAIVIIKYFISGVDAKWDAGKDSIRKEVLTTEKAYPRCIVGAVAMSELYGDHCKLKEVIEEIESAVNDKLEDHLKKDGKNLQDQLNNCTGVDLNALLIGKAILGDTIKNWKQEERVKGKQGNGEWKAWVPWVYWQIVCGSEKDHTKLQQQKEKNKEVLTEFSGMDKANTELMNELMSEKEILTLEDVRKVLETSIENGKPLEVTNLMNKLDGTIKQKQAEVCMKQDGNSLCDRLKCAKDHWKLTDGKGQPEKDFWNNSVQVKLTSLFSDAITSSIGTPANHCDNAQDLDTANKAACNHITALLSKMNTTTNGTNQLSEQIIKCALLNAYAKKLKDEAKEKGYCDIDKGLQEAFSKSSTIMQSASSQCNKDTNGPNSCFQCNWNNNDELKNCRIDNGSSPKEEVKEKVELLLKDNPQTKQEQIQQTVTEMHNKSTLCERVKCALNWYEKKNGHTEMWKKVEEEVVQPLGQAMSSTAAYGGTHCDHLDNKNKEMCLLFAKGLHHMYKETNDSGNDATKLFKRTMMCAALNAYAKKLKDDAARKNGKGSCDISGGIDHAFGKGKDIMGSAAAQCQTGNSAHCFECTQDQSLENCSINTSGGETQEVKDKLTTFLNEEDTGLKESLDKICLPCLDKENLCERAECVIGRWKANGNSHPTSDPWDDVKNELKSLSEEIQTNKGSVSNHCTDLDGDNKEACLLIASGLKSIYEIKAGQGTGKTTRKELEDQLFKRTMRCVLLNAFADKLEKLPCADEKNVKDAITKAFNDKNKDIKNASDVCKNDGDKCFKCERYESLASCLIGENSNKEKVKGKVEPMLEKYDTLKKESLEKTISVLHAMTTNQTAFADHCKNNNWKDGDAAGEANKTACKLVAAGLEHISKIQHEYSTKTGQPDKNENPYDNQEFKQLVSCLMLKAVAQKMKEDSKICDIDQGIRAAFGKADAIKGKHCQNGKPCTVCNWAEKYDDCYLDTAKEDQVKPKLEALLDEKKTEVEGALMDITKTAGNNSSTLCLRLQCLAPRVQASSSANTFWTKEGEVGELWNVLSTAMKANKNNEAQCNTMDNDNREATNPEKKACNYLHAALKKLYETTTPATPSASSSGTISLNDNPPLKQTVGCLLLHAYAKKMKGATCLVDSGIKKAFDTAVKNLIGNCNGGTESCVPCLWNEGNYDNCEITKNGTTEDQTPVKNKLEQVKDKITETSTETLTNINEMKNLCDYIKCAAPNWFKSKMTTMTNGNITANKNWCDFWNEGVQGALKTMFEEIENEGSKTSSTFPINAICPIFGDGNPQSVERKACNHIIAGLQHIKKIPNGAAAKQSNGKDNQLLHQAVGCIALNLYADQIITQSSEKCPIDEKIVQKIFDAWNGINSTSCSNSGGSGNNVCFKCERHPKFNDCELSVASSLISSTSPSSPQSGSCTSGAENKKVPEKMTNLLQDNNTTKMEEKLSHINSMTTFCSRLQCAVKQYGKKSLKKENGKTTSWDEIKVVLEGELKELLKEMNDDQKQTTVATYCNNVSSSSKNDTPGEITAKQKACKLFASGLKHISEIKDDSSKDDGPLKRTMMCAALNLYADQLISKSTEQCPLDKNKMEEAIDYAFKNSNATKNSGSSCTTQGPNFCFECKRQKSFPDCRIGNNPKDKVKERMNELLEQNKDETKMEQTLDKINSKDTFCTELQCAIIKKVKSTGKKLQNGTRPSWSDIDEDAKGELSKLLGHMLQSKKQEEVIQYCNDDSKWNTLRNKEKQTNKAACLLFASGLKHIYNQHKGSVKGPVNGPSFAQTMGCLFLKEYAKQLKELANKEKKYNVHPDCSVGSGIEHAFSNSNAIMESVLTQCKNNASINDCFVCTQNNDYNNCKIGDDNIGSKSKELFTEPNSKKHMQETLENTVCPILLTDILTPFLPLAPVSIGLSAMAYYLWKYFGPLGKGGRRFRRSPAQASRPSVQEQVLDHVEEAGPHEYRLVKERKPRSAPTRTKRSGGVNRRTIIEIHFEVLDECQKGDTQLNQKDFLELLIQEFMGSELMEEEQVPKEEVLMESVPMERVPNLGSGFMV
ncbi:SICAvar, type I [Plasmodium knowlesi strain H]|uniref:SICAvar, type I n=1 Tax=Plasmodium knowlesi (strain H) TaxID=5851 RepID=A0A679L7T3_PLAKH|nr:SICAvar, type I [Plasmodium knowlesi strain H]CAA9991107.1 SICAvar, type I [Plasmodium knowlesi strain H]VVS80581.1 SICAvar, type I [Plasmodium knowlesi strain H]